MYLGVLKVRIVLCGRIKLEKEEVIGRRRSLRVCVSACVHESVFIGVIQSLPPSHSIPFPFRLPSYLSIHPLPEKMRNKRGLWDARVIAARSGSRAGWQTSPF